MNLGENYFADNTKSSTFTNYVKRCCFCKLCYVAPIYIPNIPLANFFFTQGVMTVLDKVPPRSYSDQIRPNPTESDQIRPNPIESDQIRQNPTVGFGRSSFWEGTFYKTLFFHLWRTYDEQIC